MPAGLSSSGFEAKQLSEIKSDIEARLETFNPGFDVRPESPDGQLISIFASIASVLWDELDKVYHSYDPAVASGKSLRNIGQVTGYGFRPASRSSATVVTEGISGTVIIKGSFLSDKQGVRFYTTEEVQVPDSVLVVAALPGKISMPIGSVDTVESPVYGWTGISQPAVGSEGIEGDTEQRYRNMRARTVMRNSVSVKEVLEARLLELGVTQVSIFVNDTSATVSSVPANSIKVTVGEYTGISDQQIAQVIFKHKGLCTGTEGSHTVTINDIKNRGHAVKFDKSTARVISVKLKVRYLEETSAGATEKITEALIEHINDLEVGEDVNWSRLFGVITQFGKASIEELLIGAAGLEVASDYVMPGTSYAEIGYSNISIEVATTP